MPLWQRLLGGLAALLVAVPAIADAQVSENWDNSRSASGQEQSSAASTRSRTTWERGSASGTAGVAPARAMHGIAPGGATALPGANETGSASGTAGVAPARAMHGIAPGGATALPGANETGSPLRTWAASRRERWLPAAPASFAAGALFAPVPESTSQPPAGGAVQSIHTWYFADERGRSVSPMSVAVAGGDFYLLGPKGMWKVPEARRALASGQTLTCRSLGPSGGRVGKFPIQELNNFAYVPGHNSFIVLDKSGDLWDFSCSTQTWKVCRPNKPITGAPDPDFIDIASSGSGAVILDPERNEIWSFTCGRELVRWFEEVLPWRLKAGQPNVSQGVSIAFDHDAFILNRNGSITRYGAAGGEPHAVRKPFAFRPPRGVRPSRLVTAPGLPLYIVERENNRVLAVDKTGGKVSCFIFPGTSDLRGLMPSTEGFYIVDGNRLLYRSLTQSDPPSKPIQPRRMDPRLSGLSLPVTGVRLPRHPGVWPGARRLYRYGVHAGVDFFDDRGCSARVLMGTPARAADAGRVIRCDSDFRDMDRTQYNRVMRQCLVEHNTSDANEDLLRGCQVWLDHGKGLITRYAHLDKTRPGLRTGAFVARGEVLGDIGVSGTGQNLPGRSKHPHLHFEIWLDGKYLGWGLTPSETIGIYENIFGTSCEGN